MSNILNLVKKLSLFSQFEESELINKDKVKWLPILDCGDSGDFMGITKTGIWVVSGASGLIPIDKPEKYIFVLSLLEREYIDVINDLKKFERSGLNEVNLIEIFPFIEIVKCGIEKKSDYWFDLALVWYNKFDDYQRAQLDDSFQLVRNSKRFSQKTRHKIKKVLKKINWNNPKYFNR